MTDSSLVDAPWRLVDSITELSPTDAGCVAVSGSHGGMSSAKYGIAAKPLLCVFNDAGVGKNAAGIAALSLLEDHGLAACTVSHESACIGRAKSTYESGTVSYANTAAIALGVVVGQQLKSLRFV